MGPAMPTFFVLQPGSWPLADAHLCRPLLGTRQGRAPQMPWVSVARGAPHGTIELVRRDGLDGAQARALIDEAQAWLGGTRRTWQVTEERGVFRKRATMVRAIVPESAIGLTADPM